MNTLLVATNRIARSPLALASHNGRFGIGLPVNNLRPLDHWCGSRHFLTPRPSDHFRATESGRSKPVPYKIIRPIQQVRYARLCPFCRKARGEIQSIGRKRFQGTCPKCGATGPKREGHQEALRAWNGREFRDGTGALWGGGQSPDA